MTSIRSARVVESAPNKAPRISWNQSGNAYTFYLHTKVSMEKARSCMAVGKSGGGRMRGKHVPAGQVGRYISISLNILRPQEGIINELLKRKLSALAFILQARNSCSLLQQQPPKPTLKSPTTD